MQHGSAEGAHSKHISTQQNLGVFQKLGTSLVKAQLPRGYHLCPSEAAPLVRTRHICSSGLYICVLDWICPKHPNADQSGALRYG